MYKHYKERNVEMEEMDERQVRNKYLQDANVKLKNILNKIDINIDFPTQNYLGFFKWIAKKAIWTAILLLFSILTTKGCSNLLLQYINGITTSKIDVNKDRKFSFPSSTVCLPMYATDFYKLDENINTKNASQYLHSEVSKYFGIQHQDKETFLNGTYWSPAMLSVVYKYVSHLHFVENYEWTMVTAWNYSEYMIELHKKDWWEAASILGKEIILLNISISELTEAVGQAIAEKFKLGVTYYTAYDRRINSSYFRYKTSFVGSSWICYNVDFSGLVITSQDETIVVEVNATSLDIALDGTLLVKLQCGIVLAPSADFHLDLKALVGGISDNLIFTTDENGRLKKNYYIGYIGLYNYISYDLFQVYRFMTVINGRQQCSTKQSTEVCHAKCRASMIKNLCNCTATSLTASEDINSECTLTTYGNCSVYDANNDSMCDCLNPCTRWDYEMKELTRYYTDSIYFGSIILQLAKLDYRIFEQTYLWKTEGFIAAFGGALSLWLGIDFLMAINFFSIVMAKLIKICVKSKQPSSSSALINQGHTCLEQQDDGKKENETIGKKDNEKRNAGEELLTIKAIKPSNWSCFEILSLIVNLVFFLATIVLSTVLFHKYFSDPPLIEMSVPYDEAFELPKSAEIILSMKSIDLELNINRRLYGKIVNQYFEQNQMNKEAFLSCTDAWPQEIFALCFSYLAYLSAVEGTDLDYGNMMNISELARTKNDQFLLKNYSGELYDAAFQLEKKLSQMEVTIKELKLSVAEKLKSAFQLSVKYVYTVDGVVTKTDVSIIENTCFNEYRVCFKADFSNKPIRRSGDYIEVSSIRNRSILPVNGNLSMPLITYISELRVDFNGQIMKEVSNLASDYASIEGVYGYLIIYKVFTIDAYRKIPLVKGETKCINYEKKDQCRWQCRSEMIYKKCNCTTVSLPLPYLPPGPECSFSNYNRCLQYSKQDDMQCINQCLKPCEKWKYQVDMEKQIQLGKNEAIIQIQVKKFDYVMYREKLPWTYETFAGSIGGALGLWLGLDFVILIGAVSELLGYTMTRLLYALGLKKINAGTQVPDQVQTNEESKIHQEDNNELIFTSAIMKWSKQSFKLLIKALYSMKLGVILKLIVVKIFWSYLAVLFWFLTFNMCFLTTIQYLKNPTTTKMQFLLNSKFIMPTSTLCVPLSISNLDLIPGFANITYYESLMIKYFSQNQKNKEAHLNAIDKKWPLEVYSIIYVYLFTFSRAEGGVFDSSNPCPIDLTSSRLCPENFQYWKNEWKAIFFKLEMILKLMNISEAELLQNFGQQTLKIYNISVLHIAEESNKRNQNYIEIRETLSVDFELGICFKIDFSGATIRSEVEQFNILINSNGMRNESIYSSIIFDMHGRYMPNDKIYEIFFGFFGIESTYVIGAKEVDQIFPGKKEDPDCNEYVSPEICRSECRASLIRRLCNCTAASLPIREVSTLSDECTLAAYQNCLKYYAADDFECRKNCLQSCRREIYQWKWVSYDYIGNDNQLNLILRVEDFGYAVFEEEYEWTFVTFLGEFGGNLGLWLGLDIKMVLGEIFSMVFVIGKPLIAFIRAKIAGNAVIVI